MTRPRHAAPRPRPRNAWLWVTVTVLVGVVCLLIGSTMAPVRTVAGPVEYRDWQVPIPTTPESCRLAMAKANEMYWKLIETDEASRTAVDKLRTAKTLADIAAAKKANDKAKRAAKALTTSRRAFLDQYAQCRDAK